MAKQKVVIRVCMNGAKQYSRALTIAVGFPGVASAEIGGDNKDQVVVIGEGFDSAKLTLKLRKKMGWAEIMCLDEIKPEVEKEEEKEVENCKEIAELTKCNPCNSYTRYPYAYEVQEPNYFCIVM